jgi:outer membrane protein
MMKTVLLIISLNILWFNVETEAQQANLWTLEKCIDYALNQNIQVRKSNLSNQSYQYYADQAKAQKMPSLSASVNQNFNWSRGTTGTTGFSGSNGTSYGLNSSVTLYNASRLTNQIKQAELDIKGGEYSLETTKESISLNILNAFLQVLYAEEQVKNSEKQIESTDEQLNLASERLALQVISQSDYLQVKSQLAGEKLTLANANSQLSIARLNLMQLMELPVTDGFTVASPDLEESLNQNRIPVVQSVFGTALTFKPQIKNAAVNKEIAALDEQIARAGYYPNLSASAGISSRFTSIDNSAYFNQIDNGLSPSVGLSLSIPIYQKKQVKTSIAIARIGYQNAELSEIDTKNQLRKSIEQACNDVISAQSEYEASFEKFNSNKESFALSEERFNQGVINSVDYLIVKTNLITAESQLLQSKFRLIFNYKILDFYSGVPLSL